MRNKFVVRHGQPEFFAGEVGIVPPGAIQVIPVGSIPGTRLRGRSPHESSKGVKWPAVSGQVQYGPRTKYVRGGTLLLATSNRLYVQRGGIRYRVDKLAAHGRLTHAERLAMGAGDGHQSL